MARKTIEGIRVTGAVKRKRELAELTVEQ